MSTLQATNLKNASSASNNIVLDTAGNATVAGTMAMGSSYLRNRIINGDMRIDQRNAGASITPTTANPYNVDRWTTYISQSSKFSVQQNAGSVTPPTGFVNYLGLTSLSAYSVVSSDYFVLAQPIEGFNVSDLGWGASGALSITLSFWVRSSLTGTYSVRVTNNDGSRGYISTYTVNSANTWEQKSVTVPGDTAGTWLKTNGVGLMLQFVLGVGSSKVGSTGSWITTGGIGASGTTSLVGTNGATWYITGVQLEPGTVATPFERRPYGQELALCQRYCYRDSFRAQQYNGDASSGFRFQVCLPVTQRTASQSLTVLVSNVSGFTTPTLEAWTSSAIVVVTTANASGANKNFNLAYESSAEL